MTAFYNEIEPQAAAWLRELVKRGLIAPGVVDERDIRDIAPAELMGFTQCHFFAGIGVWSYALRQAGWPDDRPVWTGSCPCQPFSAAGKGGGFDDERHLWPAFHWLIEQCRPAVVFGEQVASKDAEPWIDLVQDDMEALDYAVGAVPFPSAGVGAPHIRDRLYWVADAQRGDGRWEHGHGLGGSAGASEDRAQEWQRLRPDPADGGTTDGLADDDDEGLEGRRQPGRERAAERLAGAGGVAGGLAHAERFGRERGWTGEAGDGRREEALAATLGPRHAGGLADAESQRERSNETGSDSGTAVQLARAEPGRDSSDDGPDVGGQPAAGPTNGLWRAADWLFCRDGKWRPVEPGTFPLAHGAPARVGRLRGYGNAINAEAATAFIESLMEALGIKAEYFSTPGVER